MYYIFDAHFTYKYVLRFIILLKLNIFNFNNSFEVPFLYKLNFFFSIFRIIDKDESTIYNYFYLFYFFFGKNAYISKYKSLFSLGIWYYSFKVFVIISKKEIYNILYYYLNNYIIMVNKSYLRSGVFSKRRNILYLVLKDLTVFTEKKTNLGLFNLKRFLNLHLYFKGGDISSSNLILKNFKIRNNFIK